MRSGGLKSKQHQVMAWAGDQTVDWTKYYKIGIFEIIPTNNQFFIKTVLTWVAWDCSKHPVIIRIAELFKHFERSDGLASSIVSALSLATSGMGLTHSDIGGYTGRWQ